ncbi:glutamine--tRNA ligase/YqeY domain fusion protein [Pelolinea submarina]|uniref:Glutamine--tRNA ligase n=1 Tax=Pelolinea submarina TaxID=913107 RepID=A0A347ZQJ6_9CHLR|nr:glutamine--tRNA ligase/YqeY domain fusion protein [Pelolinea submarina]REG06089.1 glutaminyl-tRNA synthetase [Pelolinea submarina]BBB47577.1 glutaminyl-tRNA synthetase [Pelolinea submarina]
MTNETPESTDFIHEAVAEDLRNGRFDHVKTRLPPEPNGYLHIGHVKAFLIDYNTAKDFGGVLDLRFDDTNPEKEETEFVDAIQEDAHWLGIEWEQVLFASDFFDLLYEWAVKLVKKGKAYVDDQSPDEVKASRGSWTEPGIESPWRNRSVEENLDLLERMKNGEFPDGSRVLRAKIDMAHGNMNMRDPIMYRILHEPPHHRTGSKWCIYPMYDWAHGQNDAMHGVTHSLCSIEYEHHRPLYEWFLNELEIENKPRQIEFARLNMTYTVMSKRKLRRLVEEGYVDGWDDPRMPTIRGMRRRGYTPESLRDFIDRTGVSKTISASAGVMIDVAILEACVRDDLNKRSPRKLAVLDPLKVVIENYPEDQTEEFEIDNNPTDPESGTRKVPFSKVIYIEKDDFREVAPPKYHRLAPGQEVRLRNAYFIKCEDVVKDANGEIVEVRCSYDPTTRGGNAPDGRKVKGTIHWVSATHGIPVEVRLYDRLFNNPDPEASGDFIADLNPDSRQTLTNCIVEPSLKDAQPGDKFQFERVGYFCVDIQSTPEKLIFNRTVSLRDTWAKIEETRGK